MVSLIIFSTHYFLASLTLSLRAQCERIQTGFTHSLDLHCVLVSPPSPITLITGAYPGFGHGGGSVCETESCRCSETESHERSEQSVAGSRARLSFWVFNAQISIPLHSRGSFLTFILTSKVYKNRTLDCTLINLRHSYIFTIPLDPHLNQ